METILILVFAIISIAFFISNRLLNKTIEIKKAHIRILQFMNSELEDKLKKKAIIANKIKELRGEKVKDQYGVIVECREAENPCTRCRYKDLSETLSPACIHCISHNKWNQYYKKD